MTDAHAALIRLLAAQAVRQHLTSRSPQTQAIPANDSNRAIPQAANSR